MLRFWIALSAAIVTLTIPAATIGRAEEPLSYDRDVRPILSENCFACHGFDEKSREAGLRLDTRAGAVDDSGAIEPGSPEGSLIVERMLAEDGEERMPPSHSGKELTPKQIEIIKRWIAEGAVYEKHWAFSPPTAKVPPATTQSTNPIDGFVAAQLSEHGINPSPAADAATIIRRLSLDLIGLPPSPQQVSEFEAAAAKNLDVAVDALVDQLLDSQHYGERWGRWWLDQARYADSHGYSIDGERVMWHYRDWVIKAFNEDKGFDQFTIEQLAGDLLPTPSEEQLIATGFHRNTQINQEGGVDPEQFRMESVFDRVATTGNVWLGLSVGCAQCHDHKFDPISQREYYQLFAFLNNQDEPEIKVYPAGVDPQQLQQHKKQIEARLAETLIHALSIQPEAYDDWEAGLDDAARKKLGRDIERRLGIAKQKRSAADKAHLLLASGVLTAAAEPETAAIDNLNDGAADAAKDSDGKAPDAEDPNAADLESDELALQLSMKTLLEKLLADLQAVDLELDQASSAMVLKERAERRDTFLLIKGDFTRPDEVVLPGTLSVLHPMDDCDDRVPNRLDLARWLIDDDNPLTSRVIANRVWQQLFGRGLVDTENDFGLQGTPPTHPDLLDWLAVEFRSHNWSLKQLIRTIVTSKTYLQSSVARVDLADIDPLNFMLARQNRMRLDAEIVRDVALVASGLFCDTVGGPSVRPPIPDGVMTQGQVKRGWKVSDGGDRYRRAMYTFAYRATPPPYLNVFDAPDGLSSCTRRMRSNTPLQALTLLNDPAFVEFAQAMEKVVAEHGLETAFQRCTSRLPTADELALLNQLDSLNVARALLNLDETITRE